MQIEDLKTWHWVVFGLLAGVLFSCVRTWQGPAFANLSLDTIAVGEFERQAYSGTKYAGGGPSAWLVDRYHKDLPLLSNVVVHPPLAGDPLHQYWITGRAYWIGNRFVDPTKVGSKQELMWGWRGFKYAAATPYFPGYAQRITQLQEELKERQSRLNNQRMNMRLQGEIFGINAELRNVQDMQKAFGGQASFPTVLDFLKRVKSSPGSTLKTSYAWYELPAAVWVLPPIAGLLLIGIAWPFTLSIMQNFGMARAPAVAKKPKQAAAPAAKPTSIPSTAGVVFKPAITAATPAAADEPHNEYRGEFYPVVKATHKE